MATVRDVVKLIEIIADPGIAETWDNCGLQVGSYDQPVKKIVMALDPLLEVVEYACSVNADLLVTHHPLIFRPVKRIDFSTHLGRIVGLALKHSLSIYSAHTSYDSAKGGLNDILAERAGLIDIKVLRGAEAPRKVKLVVFTPLDHKETVLGALAETKAGMIGDYTCCSFSVKGMGRYKSGSSCRPYSGSPGELSEVEELRIETIIDEKDLARTVSHIRKVHPYETMAYDVYPLEISDNDMGIGRIGTLKSPVPVLEYAGFIKQKFGRGTIKMAGPTDIVVNKVAVCSGSGSSLMSDFLKSQADVFLSGDLSYHDARNAEEHGRVLLDLGHFSSEIIMIEALKESLWKICSENRVLLDIIPCPMERDPYLYM